MKAKLNIAMVVGGLPFDGNTLLTKSLGGSETAAIYMAKALARAECDVLVFCNTPDPMTDEAGVRYLPLGAWGIYSKGTPHDVTIIQRDPQLCGTTINTRLNVLWCHDLALGRMQTLFRSALWNLDFAFVLSEYMKQQYIQTYAVDESVLRVTRNGIDTSLFSSNDIPIARRDRFHLVYSARPERGLDVLLEKIMPRLIKMDKRFHLTVCGYENTVPQWAEFYARCDRSMKALGPQHAVRGGALTKNQLYGLYEHAGAYVYPTPSPSLPAFSEISCISAMECQAAGLPFISSARGALPETLKGGGFVLVDGDPSSDRYIDEFCQACLSYATDDDLFQEGSSLAREHARTLDWQPVAWQWIELFEKEIRQRNSDNDRALRGLWRNSDIIVAQQWLKESPQDFKEPDRLKTLLEPFAFTEESEGYRKQYERIGATHDTWVYDTAPREPRFGLLSQWLQEHQDEVKTVLDYGCAHGAYAIGLAKQHPELRIHGVDIDHFSTDMATEWAAKREVSDRATFEVWTHDLPSPDNKKYDAALLQEVLEHVPDPRAVIEAVEKRVKKDGFVYITVPYGPWEYSSYHNYPWRCHVWHFDQHDIRDMLSKKSELIIDSYYAGDSQEIGTPLGWWIVSYRADHEPLGNIDIDRKKWLQRHRQTVSAALIAGGESVIETVMWNLRSLYHVADEIVIADCGVRMNQLDEAIRLLGDAEPHARWSQKIKIIEGVDPLVEGFESARNTALDACTMDWILWIDTDEKLMNQASVHKYLRENFYHGYGIRQHHLSCDHQMPPDMPVRLFRRRAHRDGRTLRFTGALHEHPELELNAGPGPIVVLSDVHIAHLGYLTEQVRQQRFARNFRLLELDTKRYPDRLLQKFFLMRDKVQIARFEMGQNGGVATPQIRALMKEVVELGQKHFIGKGNYMNSDALAYYSEALEVLGEGFHATLAIAADKVRSQSNGQMQYRFANKEDFMAEFSRRVSEKIDPLVQEHY